MIHSNSLSKKFTTDTSALKFLESISAEKSLYIAFKFSKDDIYNPAKPAFANI